MMLFVFNEFNGSSPFYYDIFSSNTEEFLLSFDRNGFLPGCVA